jgi:hypothetical protein
VKLPQQRAWGTNVPLVYERRNPLKLSTTALVVFTPGTVQFAEAPGKNQGRNCQQISGEISDLVVSKDGDIDTAFIEVGGFLGVG